MPAHPICKITAYGPAKICQVTSMLLSRTRCRATRDYAGVSTSNKLLVLLTFSCGMFTSSTSLLPSSFAMYMVTWAASSVIRQKKSQLVFAAVACVVWGWPVTGIYPRQQCTFLWQRYATCAMSRAWNCYASCAALFRHSRKFSVFSLKHAP